METQRMSEETVMGYLRNRKDTLKRQITDFSSTLRLEVRNTENRLDNIPVELYPEVQKLLGDYKKLIEFMEGF